MKLTDKQQKFCEEYMIDLNATQAAIRAGYSEDTARAIGCENLTKPDIQSEVQRLMKERSERTKITADRVLNELAKLAFANIDDYITITDGLPSVDLSALTRDQAAAIVSFDIDTRHEGRTGAQPSSTVEKVKFKMADKGQNLERLGRHLKLFTDKHELTGEDGAPVNFTFNPVGPDNERN